MNVPYASLPRARPPYVLLDFADDAGRCRTRLFRDPVSVLEARSLIDVRRALAAAERAAAAGHHVVGFVTYDAAPAFDDALEAQRSADLPLAWFGVYREPVEVGTEAPRPPAESGSPPLASGHWTPSVARDHYHATVSRLREATGRGDVYQVNHTFRLRGEAPEDTLSWYVALRAAQRARYAAYLDLGAHRILSVSPELFFARRGPRIVVRPMKGTARRGRWAAEDDARAAALAHSEKERAENVMIVDLLRNDLGRIAVPGSVAVERLFEVERYPTVLQMTSTIAATLRPDVALEDIFAALFPCGSVTGAPKVASARLIAALEDAPRGVYCGAIGHIEPSGACTFNVAIRTAVVDVARAAAEYGVGGAITWDSTAAGEYDEALAKAAVLGAGPPPFALLETMRLEDGVYVRLERHLARLAASARYFGFPLDDGHVQAALAEHAASVERGAPRRVRLRLAEDGRATVDGTPLDERHALGDAPRAVALAERPVDSASPLLYHKTTARSVYDEARAARAGAWDVLLWNERGEATEFTIGNLVAELDGVRWTPPVECGLLGGVFRAELVESGKVRERPIAAAELTSDTPLWLVNSMREWVPVRLASGGARQP